MEVSSGDLTESNLSDIAFSIASRQRRNKASGFPVGLSESLQVIEHRVANAALNGPIAVHHHEPVNHRFRSKSYDLVAGERH